MIAKAGLASLNGPRFLSVAPGKRLAEISSHSGWRGGGAFWGGGVILEGWFGCAPSCHAVLATPTTPYADAVVCGVKKKLGCHYCFG